MAMSWLVTCHWEADHLGLHTSSVPRLCCGTLGRSLPLSTPVSALCPVQGWVSVP